MKLGLAVARVEARHLLRSPAVVASVGLSIPILALGPGTDDSFTRYKILAGAGCVVVAVGTGLGAALAVSRARRSGTDELLRSLPADASSITSGHLLSAGASLLPAVAVLAVLAVRLRAWDGFAVPVVPGLAGAADPARLTPGLAAFAQGPAIVVLAGVVGVALGTWARSSLVPSIVLIGGGYLLPLPMLWWSWDWQRWFVPLAHGLDTAPVVTGPQGTVLIVHRADAVAMGWHVLYVGALIVVVAAVAFARVPPLRRAWRLAAGGLAVGTAAGTLQIVTAH